jgi:hypothetical protein
MPATEAPLSASILYRDQRKTAELLEAAAKEWARYDQPSAEAADLLAQMIVICLRGPEMMRDLWDWARAAERAGWVRDREEGGEVLRDQFENWLRLLQATQQAAAAYEGAGFPVSGAEELKGAADQLREILGELNEAWPPQELRRTPPLSYEELSELADRFPPPPAWWEEEFDDLF